MANGLNGVRLTVLVGVLGIISGIGGKGLADRLSTERITTASAVEINTIKGEIGDLKRANQVLGESAVSVREFSQFAASTDKRLDEIRDELKLLRTEIMQGNRRGK